jgi:serine/threonine protein kinase
MENIKDFNTKKFVVVEALGKGMFGEVSKVQKVTGLFGKEFYAMKCIPLPSNNDIENKELLNEFEIQRKLKHDNIVQVIDVYVERGGRCDLLNIVMELCETDTQKYLDNPKDILEYYDTTCNIIAINWIPQLVDGLKHIHSHSIIHRDIKPGMKRGKKGVEREGMR